MAEVLAAFSTPIASGDGHFYTARACGGKAVDGLWQGWIEFTPVDGGTSIRSPRETTQPNRVDAEYWATGLTPVYLEGALQRALSGPPPTRHAPSGRPAFEAPLPAARHSVVGSREAALDPFSTYEKGEHLLRQQLGALSDWHLVNIALAYELTDESVAMLNRRSSAYLAELIVSSVRSRQKIGER
jgi:hypothetical protein